MNWPKKHPILFALAVNAAYFAFYYGAWEGRANRISHADMYTWITESSASSIVYAVLPPRFGPTKATSYYSKEQNQLNVYPKDDLLLLNRGNRKVLLSPIFSVSGSTVTPPATIILRFYSFADALAYPDRCTLRITVDGEAIWSDPNLIRSITTGEEEKVVESFTYTLPYKKFFQAVAGERVKVSLAGDEFELTAEQVEALRDMHRCVADGACR
ncbi:MAG: hypothetical protein ACRD9R_11045 [Pyrinomonadaceae bacterium]